MNTQNAKSVESLNTTIEKIKSPGSKDAIHAVRIDGRLVGFIRSGTKTRTTETPTNAFLYGDSQIAKQNWDTANVTRVASLFRADSPAPFASALASLKAAAFDRLVALGLV